jgi:hypothetical protein
VNGHDRDGGYGGKDDGQHSDDEPGSSIGGLRRGLGDAHRVDERVRDDEEEFHGVSMMNLKR